LVGINRGIEQRVQELRERYDQPNWFKIAAGFAKPQLGGFTASLGSAAEAAGEGFEQRRALEVPLFKMRTDLATNQALIKRNKDVNEAIARWKADPKNQGLPLPAEFATYLAQAPEASGVTSLQAQVKQSQEQRALSQKEQSQQIQILEAKQKSLENLRRNGEMSYEEFNRQNREIMNQLASLQSASPFVNPSSRANIVDNVPVNQPSPSGATSPSPSPATSTSSAPSAARPSASANAPATTSEANQTDLTNYRLTPTFTTTMLHPNPMTEDEKYRNESIRTEAANLEKGPREQWSILQKQMAATPFNTALKANQSGLEMIDKEPNTVAEISEILRRKGPTAELLSKGIGISIGPLGANISIKGIEPALIADLPKDKRDAYDKLLNALAKSTYYDLVSRGIDPEKEGSAKFGQMMLQEAGMAQGAAAIHRTFAENNERLMHNKRIFDAAKVILPKMNASKSLTPYYDFYNNHPEVKVLDKVLQNRLSKIQ
jgi:hypothetical protein